MTNQWYSLGLGDGMLAVEPSEEIQTFFCEGLFGERHATRNGGFYPARV